MGRIFGPVALALALVAGIGLGTAARAEDKPALPPVPDMVLGSPEAKVTLTEYASFTCPHCAQFHETVFKPLKADYIDTGKVRFVYREVFFDRPGLWAAMVARCGGESRYFGIAAMLFDGQREWAAANDPATIADNLRRIGRTAGMEDAAIDACLNDRAMAEAMVATYMQHAAADGVEATPTLFVNGTRHSNMSYADLKAILDAELAK